MSVARRPLTVLLGLVLTVDAMLLAVLELFYLPWRLGPEHGGWMIPVSILVAAVTTPLLVWAAGRTMGGLLGAMLPLGAWGLTVLVIGVAGPGGDVVLPGDFRSLLLLLAAVLPSGVVLGRLTARALDAAVEPAAGAAPEVAATPGKEDSDGV